MSKLDKLYETMDKKKIKKSNYIQYFIDIGFDKCGASRMAFSYSMHRLAVAFSNPKRIKSSNGKIRYLITVN